MVVPELPEDARKDQLQAALAIRHPGEGRVLGLVLKDTLLEDISVPLGKRNRWGIYSQLLYLMIIATYKQ